MKSAFKPGPLSAQDLPILTSYAHSFPLSLSKMEARKAQPPIILPSSKRKADKAKLKDISQEKQVEETGGACTTVSLTPTSGLQLASQSPMESLPLKSTK